MQDKVLPSRRYCGGNDTHGYDRNQLAKQYMAANPTMKVTRRVVDKKDYIPIY